MFFSAVVFDFDGVIVESTDIKSAAFYKVALTWGEDAARRMAEYHASHFGISRYEKFEWFFRTVLGKSITPEESASLDKQFSLICLKKILNAPLVPGFTDTLAVAFGRCPLYVASATPQDELEVALEKRNLDTFFKQIFGSPTPKTENLQLVVDSLNVKPSTVLMVGDSPWDLAAAKAVGTDFYGRGGQFKDCGFTWGEDLRNLAAYLSKKLS